MVPNGQSTRSLAPAADTLGCMNWIPEGADFLHVFGAVLAVGTTLIGLFVSLGQFTGSARARRYIGWTTAALETEEDEARRAVLARLKLRGQGYLLAADYVPWWKFTEVAVWTLLSPALVGVAAYRDDPTMFSALIFAGVVNLAIVIRRATRLYAERMRVAQQFVVGGADVEPVRIDMLGLMEGGVRREFVIGVICAVSIMGTAALIAWGATAPRGTQAWSIVGILASASSFQWLRSHAASWAGQNIRQQ